MLTLLTMLTQQPRSSQTNFKRIMSRVDAVDLVPI
jgi:hypothetical protein